MDNRFMPYPIDPYLIAERFANYNPEEEAKKQDMMENCCHIEYEQDMGAHIPFCRLDGQMCNMQCLKDKPKPRPIDGDMVWQSPGVKDMRCNCLTEPPKPKNADAGTSKGERQMITTKDKIGYIRRQEYPDGTTEFKFIEAKIKSIRIGKRGTSVYSDKFRAMDAYELESNAKIMSGNSAIVLVGEPFITNAEMTDRIKKVVGHWNKYGAETILGNRTEPPKEDNQ